MMKDKKQIMRGFTLIELLIILSILGVIMTLAVPNLTSSLQANAVRNTGNDLRSSISLARSTALGQRANGNVRICKATSTASSCDSASADWTTGWIVWRDINGDGTINNGEREGIFTAASGATVTAGAAGNLSFDGRGFATGVGSFTVANSDNSISCSVSILGTGIPRAENC